MRFAFNALSVSAMDVELDGEREQVTHLGLVMVNPEVQGAGAVVGALWPDHAGAVAHATACARNGFGNLSAGAGGVRHGLREPFSDVFPSPHQEPAARALAHLQLARGIMRLHRAVFGGVGDAGRLR